MAAGGSGAWKQCTSGSAVAAQGREGCDADGEEHGVRAWQRELQRRGGNEIAECEARWQQTTEVTQRYVVRLLEMHATRSKESAEGSEGGKSEYDAGGRGPVMSKSAGE